MQNMLGKLDTFAHSLRLQSKTCNRANAPERASASLLTLQINFHDPITKLATRNRGLLWSNTCNTKTTLSTPLHSSNTSLSIHIQPASLPGRLPTLGWELSTCTERPRWPRFDPLSDPPHASDNADPSDRGPFMEPNSCDGRDLCRVREALYRGDTELRMLALARMPPSVWPPRVAGGCDAMYAGAPYCTGPSETDGQSASADTVP